MKNQAFNPFLPGWEYIPDGEPHVFGDRVYLYGSHDRFNGDGYCQNNYVCWSTPTDDLSSWSFHGEIYDLKNDPFNKDGLYCGYAPDCCQGPDGRFYLYYALNNHLAMSVAVCDTPAGKYSFLGHVRTEDGRIWGTEAGDAYVFDPGVLVEDGKVHLYMGFSPTKDMADSDFARFLSRWDTKGCHHVELCDDMLTMKTAPIMVAPGSFAAQGTSFMNHSFFEAPSIRKFFGKYFLIYSSEKYHELCYALGDTPTGPFEYKGCLVSNGDIGIGDNYRQMNQSGNNHGSLAEIQGSYYIFYHRHTNNTDYSRQACAEKIELLSDGIFLQAELTSCGLNGGPLKACGEYSTGIACNITADYEDHPYITQNGVDREENDDQYIKNMTDGTFVGFKYFDFSGNERISLKVKASDDCEIVISKDIHSEPFAKAFVKKCSEVCEFSAVGAVPAGVHSLFFIYRGTGCCDLISFSFN